MNLDEEFHRWKRSRENEADKIKERLEKAARWQKRFDLLMNAERNAEIESRVKKLGELIVQKNITFVPGRREAFYEKGDVKFELRTYFAISAEGVVSASFYSYKHAAYPLRIAVGKNIRVTDRILATLLGNK